MSEAWQRELETATEAARSAGRVTLRWFQAPHAVDLKSDGSPVTAADRASEETIRRILKARFPDDGIVGEEHGEETGRSGRRWIVDPIDGTRSFIHGVPLYGVMVALEADGRPVVGALYFPALDETVAAATGRGCRWNGRPCHVSDVGRLDQALLLTSGDARSPGFPGGGADLGRRLAGLRRLQAGAGTVRTWGDCYGYALVATGRAEVMVDPVLQIWDAAAVRPVMEEAGGEFTDWAGATSHLSGHAVATNARLADAVRRELALDEESVR